MIRFISGRQIALRMSAQRLMPTSTVQPSTPPSSCSLIYLNTEWWKSNDVLFRENAQKLLQALLDPNAVHTIFTDETNWVSTLAIDMRRMTSTTSAVAASYGLSSIVLRKEGHTTKELSSHQDRRKQPLSEDFIGFHTKWAVKYLCACGSEFSQP